MLESTMQDFPLTIGMILRHGQAVYGDSEVVTFEGESSRRASYAGVVDRAERLAAALAGLGIARGDRVGTFCWNNQEHLEAYLAVPAMGAVLHTLNIRLFPELLAYVANHAEDRVVIVDDSLVPLLANVATELKTVEHYLVVGDGDASALEDAAAGAEVVRYREVLDATDAGFAWPDLDERAAAAMCYTSGTTGNPKGVVYSHRSTFLHSVGVNAAGAVGLTDRDRVLPIVPMFHANAWGLPYAAWLSGADFVMPDRFLQAEPLGRLIEAERPTVAGAVPTIWSDLLRHAETVPVTPPVSSRSRSLPDQWRSWQPTRSETSSTSRCSPRFRASWSSRGSPAGCSACAAHGARRWRRRCSDGPGAWRCRS
jgi:fatty-acyl-CoA synthase